MQQQQSTQSANIPRTTAKPYTHKSPSSHVKLSDDDDDADDTFIHNFVTCFCHFAVRRADRQIDEQHEQQTERTREVVGGSAWWGTSGYDLLLRSDFMNEITALGVLIRLMHISLVLDTTSAYQRASPQPDPPFPPERRTWVYRYWMIIYYLYFIPIGWRRKKNHYNKIFKWIRHRTARKFYLRQTNQLRGQSNRPLISRLFCWC